MTHSRRKFVMSLLGMWLVGVYAGCTAVGPNEKVRHGLEIEVDKSVGRAVNIRYTYGDEFVNSTKPSAIAIGPMFTYIAPMRIPEEFEISWETQDGKQHEATVPVRGRLPGSVENKTVLFVIMQDHIEGYVSVSTPYGPKRERFY